MANKKYIDQKQFESLCSIQCTQQEICEVLGVTDKTLTNWCKEIYSMPFSEVFKAKRSGGKASLRRKQWNLADKNAAMCIWLGKQYLGQKDNLDLNHSGDLGVNINVVSASFVKDKDKNGSSSK